MRKAFYGLYSDMQRAYAECQKQQQHLEPIVKMIDSKRKLPLPSTHHDTDTDFDFFPKEIKDYIWNERSTAITYQFNAYNRKVFLHFVVFNTPTPDLKKIQADAKRVCALVHLVSMQASRPTCSATLNIYIYMTDFKKRFPTEKGQPLDAEHANTGLSYHCAKNNDVIVYRKEEWFKVLIHELFHAFGLSFIDSDMEDAVNSRMQRVLHNTYAISHQVHIYETYCEIWARILNVVFDCFMDDDANPIVKIHQSNVTDLELQVFMECVMEGLHENSYFAQEQFAKLMQYMDLTCDIISNPTEANRAIVAEKYRENTNIFAYYVLTCDLLYSPDEFIIWCYKNNPFKRTTPRANIMQFRTIPSNFNGFMELLRYCKQRCPDLNSVQPNDADVLGSSMRMTVKRGRME